MRYPSGGFSSPSATSTLGGYVYVDPNRFMPRAKQSLYRSPAYTPKHPIMKSMYRAVYTAETISSLLSAPRLAVNMRNSPPSATHVPWPMSPYMTPNRKGKVTAVKRAGLASL